MRINSGICENILKALNVYSMIIIYNFMIWGEKEWKNKYEDIKPRTKKKQLVTEIHLNFTYIRDVHAYDRQFVSIKWEKKLNIQKKKRI